MVNESSETILYGPIISTPELHEIFFDPSDNCVPSMGKYCFKRTKLTIKVQSTDWIFTGTPYVDVVLDNQGAAAWNTLGVPDRFKVIKDTPTEKVVEILTSSRSIQVRLACKAKMIKDRTIF